MTFLAFHRGLICSCLKEPILESWLCLCSVEWFCRHASWKENKKICRRSFTGEATDLGAAISLEYALFSAGDGLQNHSTEPMPFSQVQWAVSSDIGNKSDEFRLLGSIYSISGEFLS